MHSDTFGDHVTKLGQDLFAHTPEEQQHLLQAFLEGTAGTMLKMTGNDVLGDGLQNLAKNELAQGHLTFGDKWDIYKTVDHLV